MIFAGFVQLRILCHFINVVYNYCIPTFKEGCCLLAHESATSLLLLDYVEVSCFQICLSKAEAFKVKSNGILMHWKKKAYKVTLRGSVQTFSISSVQTLSI